MGNRKKTWQTLGKRCTKNKNRGGERERNLAVSLTFKNENMSTCQTLYYALCGEFFPNRLEKLEKKIASFLQNIFISSKAASPIVLIYENLRNVRTFVDIMISNKVNFKLKFGVGLIISSLPLMGPLNIIT